MIDRDVLIVGCGPVGSMLGLLLARRDLSVSVFERDPGVYQLPRAINIDDEIQRVFLNLGLFDRLAPLLTPFLGAEFVDTDFKRLMGADTPRGFVGSMGLPPGQAYYQPEFDEFLRECARDSGVEIRLDSSVTAIHDREEGVEIDVDGQPTASARWLVGCDGAGSMTRRSRGIGFEDKGFDQDWLVVDFVVKHDDVDLPLIPQQVCDPARPSTFVPGHGPNRRWEFQIQPGETPEHMERPERIYELVAPWGVTEMDLEIIRAVVYRFHATVADRMRDGAVFLAGDAAHQMPPFLGQGLNTGMRDAANLAWKMRLVRDGVAGDRLLDTYGQERRPHAEAVVEHAADVGRLIDQMAGRDSHGVDLSSGYGGGRGRPKLETGAVVGDDRLVGRQLSQTVTEGVYSDERLGSGFAVVVADQALNAPDSWRQLLGAAVVSVEPSLIDGHGSAIVRPDKYVAAVADSQAELDSVTTELLARLAVTV